MRYRFICLCLLYGLAHAATPPLQAVPRLDLSRYMGTWYEIAKYPNRYQAMCVANTTASYRLAGSRVEVMNRCRRADGTTTEASGVARRVGGNDSAVLEVRFAPAWLAWLPEVWAPYWVFDLDPDYTLAAVGQPGREYLWILSRTPQVDPGRYAALLKRIAAAGYDVNRLEPTPQLPSAP
jgi:apolipoprotein D and lipocalin family protein